MKEQLAKIRAAALEAIADSNAAAALDSVRVKYLGKKGELTSVLKQMGKLSAEERPVIGQIANEVRETLTKAIADQQSKLAEKALEAKLASETLDVSIPGIKTQLGHRHPVNQVIDMVTEIFLGMGFTRAEGPEVELADYNTGFMELKQGSVDAIAADLGVAKFQIASNEGDYVILDEPISTEQYAIGFLKGNTELRDAVNAELLKMAEDGTMLSIAEKYVDQGLVIDSLCLVK